MVRDVDTLILGAGFAGVCAGAQLRAAGRYDFVVLDRGVIAEQGSHDELMELDGMYAAQVRAGGSFVA